MIFLILLFLFATPVFAETYAVETSEGVAIVTHFEDSSDSLEEILKDSGLSGNRVIKIQASDLPPRSERKYWKLNDVPIGPKVVIDTVKKQADEDDRDQKSDRRKTLAKKMGLTDAEYDEAKTLGLIG